MTEPQTPEPIWGAHDLPPGASRQWRLGPLRVFCRRTDEELWIAHAYGDESELAPAVEEPPGLTWSRWAHSAPVETIQFVPGFPDRPVVVKPESPFRMTPGAAARIYVRAPLWLRAFLGGLRLRPLAEIPAIKLSNTWFGDFTQGELCYWLSSGARREIEPDPSRPYLAICPIWLVNASESDLNVEKICLRVGGLSLFESNGQLWADETRVRWRGAHQGARIESTGAPPPEAPQARLAGPPRQPGSRTLLAGAFASLADLPGLGFLAV